MLSGLLTRDTVSINDIFELKLEKLSAKKSQFIEMNACMLNVFQGLLYMEREMLNVLKWVMR